MKVRKKGKTNVKMKIKNTIQILKQTKHEVYKSKYGKKLEKISIKSIFHIIYRKCMFIGEEASFFGIKPNFLDFVLGGCF